MTLYFLSQCSNILVVDIHFFVANHYSSHHHCDQVTLNCTHLEQDLSRFKRLHVHVGTVHLGIIMIMNGDHNKRFVD